MLKGFIVGLIFGSGITVYAASGDLIYEVTESIVLSSTDAADLADVYIAKGVWSGSRSRMQECTVSRDPGASTVFHGSCSGTKSAPVASLPINGGVQVVGVEP